MSKFYIGEKLALDPDVKLEKVELTQAEYDALTTKKDNVLYLITDAKNPLEDIVDEIDKHMQNVTPGLNHIPDGGADKQVLAYQSNGKAKWEKLTNLLPGVEDMLSYGVSWKPNVADPVLTRVGNMQLHKELPIQSGMKGCIYDCINKKVVYWLDPEDWRFREEPEYGNITGSIGFDADYELSGNIIFGGTHVGAIGEENNTELIYFAVTDSVYGKVKYSYHYVSGGGMANTWVSVESTNVPIDAAKTILSSHINLEDGPLISNVELGSRLDGYDGEVMVYVPGFFIRSWDESDRREVRISTIKIDDSWEYQPSLFLGAYRDTVLNTVPDYMGYLSELPVNSAISVANSAAYCRGGNNNSTNDANEDIFKRQLGKCRTYIPRGTFRGYARNAGKEIMSYRQYKNIMYWLYVIEYANFNSQAPYNGELTAEGFHQGGLGNGLTNVSNWQAFNNYYPISPNGYTDEFGNGTGTKLIAPLGPAPVGSVYATRWRGLENPFGDIWNNVDGIIIDADADNHPNNMNYVYTTDDPSKYGDTLADIANMILSGLEVHTEGYTKEWDLGTTAEIIPRLMGGNTTQYKCDYHWVGDKNTTPRTLLLGGSANAGSTAGFGLFHSYNGVASSDATVGFRSACNPLIGEAPI